MTKNKLVVSIQQPKHLPWLESFNKIACVDLVVLHDLAQFRRRDFDC